MAQIDVRRTYADGDILLGADLDAFLDDVETFLNVTKINDDNIQNNGITASSKLADASVTLPKMANNSVSTTKIVDLAVTTGKINDLAVTTGKVADAAITEPKLATDSVTTAKIVNANVTEPKLAADSVTTAKIVDANITAAKIASGQITQVKMGAVGQQSSSTINVSSSSSSFVTVTNSSVSITTTGRPVQIRLETGTAGTSSYFGNNPAGASSTGEIRILRDGNVISTNYMANMQYPPASLAFLDAVAAGTYTYTLQHRVLTGAGVIVSNCKLVVYEM